MKRIIFSFLFAVALSATAQSVSVNGTNLVIDTVVTNRVTASRPQLLEAKTQLQEQITILSARLKEVEGYISMADSLKVPNPEAPKPVALKPLEQNVSGPAGHAEQTGTAPSVAASTPPPK